MRVVIWGSYQWGNFGDDLMAVMISLFLKRHGFHPIVYRLHSSIAATYNIETTQFLEEALIGSSALIIGGGNFLGSVSQIDDDWVELEACLSKHNTPIHFISIGGDGSESPHLCPSAYRVLSSNRLLSGTVRLKSDLPSFRLINLSLRKLDFYHDIVLDASTFFQAKNTTSKTAFSICNIGHSRGAKALDLLSFSLQAINRPAVRFASTHLQCLKSDSNYKNLNYEYISPSLTKNIRYNNIQSFVDLIASSCYVVSSKLHLGVAAMSYGIPFISINGAGKTIGFMSQLGLQDVVYSCSLVNPLKLPKFFLQGSIDAIAAKHRGKAFATVKSSVEDSKGHWERLLEFMGRI
jgi:hypothetical protein